MENSTLLTEKPIQGRSGAAKTQALMNTLRDLKPTVYTVPDNSRGGFTRPKDEFLKKDKNFIRNVISGMNQKSFRKEDVGNIIQQGVSSYLNQNKNISVKDLLTKKSREKAGNQLKTTLKSTALDTGQNVINHLRKEEVSRRKKPSNVRKAKRLEYALLTLKQKKDDAKKAGALKEGIGTMTDADIARTGATPEMQAKVKAKRDAKLKNQKPTTQKSSGETKQLPGQKGISGSDNNKSLKSGKDEKDTSSSNNKDGAIVKSKGSALATKGKKDNEVKDERKPKPYRDKKKERKGIKGPSKDAINKTVSKVGSAAKSGLSAFTSGYDNENVKEQKSFSQYTEAAALALPLIPLANKAIATGAAAWSLYNMSKKKSPGQKNIPGFQGAKSKETSWGHSKSNPVRDELKQKRSASKTRKFNQAQSDAARARENAARKARGEGELPLN